MLLKSLKVYEQIVTEKRNANVFALQLIINYSLALNSNVFTEICSRKLDHKKDKWSVKTKTL